jgi:predicted RNA-binding protein YlqC (UPF0109 family)
VSDVEYEEGDVNTIDPDDDGDDYEDDDDDNTVKGATAIAVLEYLAKSLVEDPDSLEVDVDDSRNTLRLNVHAAPDDLGRLIGRRGRVASAIRTVVRAAASRDDITVDVEFVD